MLNQLRARFVEKGPQLLRLPVQLTPFAVKKPLLQKLLNWQFRQALEEGELDFLEGRWLGVEIRDLALRWTTSVTDGQLLVAEGDNADVWFRGEANDLLLVAARKVDPDTLFFQRRLVIEGDTELGLEVKNVMDAIDPEMMPAPLRIGLMQMANFVEAGITRQTKSTAVNVGA